MLTTIVKRKKTIVLKRKIKGQVVRRHQTLPEGQRCWVLEPRRWRAQRWWLRGWARSVGPSASVVPPFLVDVTRYIINKGTGRTPPPNAPRGPAVLGIGAKTMESGTVVITGLDSVDVSVSKHRTTMVGRCHSMDLSIKYVM